MSALTRRRFVKGSLAAAGGSLLVGGSRSFGKVLGANDRIRIGVAGINGRGDNHIGAFMGIENVEVACLIDPDSRLFKGKARGIEEKTGKRPKCVQDIRKALDDKSLDAISIATPNHWHSLMTIWACQAGKDVYVEKPMSHNVHEGRVAVQAARKYKRIVQHGTQSRSSMGWAKAVAAIQSGKLGKLKVARGLCYKSGSPGGRNTRGDIGFRPHKQPPKELDWSLWLGPARMQPYHENLVHYRWHWFWDFGNGDLGNQGVHQMDIARWGTGGTLPKSVISFGGRLGHYDQGEAASTQMAIMDFGETQLIFETRGLPSKPYREKGSENVFHLEAGTIVNQKFYPNGSKKPADLPDVEHSRGPGGKEWRNFIAAMRSRKVSDLNADVLEGHYSSALCHLCNVSIRLGHKVPFQPRTNVFDDNEAAADVLERTEQYLGDNGMNLEKSGYTLGRKLVVDAETETIVNDAQANQMMTRCYRKEFAVPEKIA